MKKQPKSCLRIVHNNILGKVIRFEGSRIKPQLMPIKNPDGGEESSPPCGHSDNLPGIFELIKMKINLNIAQINSTR